MNKLARSDRIDKKQLKEDVLLNFMARAMKFSRTSSFSCFLSMRSERANLFNLLPMNLLPELLWHCITRIQALQGTWI